MKEKDYLRKRQEIQADYKKKVDALETVWRLFNPDLPLPFEEEAPELGGSVPAWTFEISKKRAVQYAAQALTDEFRIEDVRTALRAMNPGWSNGISDAQLSSIVSKAASSGKLIIVHQKTGRTAAVYKNPNMSEPDEEEEDSDMTLDA